MRESQRCCWARSRPSRARTCANHGLPRLNRRRDGALPSELLDALHVVFGRTLVAALDLIDRRAVTRISSPRGRTMYCVRGQSGAEYGCLPESNYCPCDTFDAVLRNEALMVCSF